MKDDFIASIQVTKIGFLLSLVQFLFHFLEEKMKPNFHKNT